ncbi:MAG: hypothetical protein ABR563_10565, partial [Pyrinomonadaceae bacterium]
MKVIRSSIVAAFAVAVAAPLAPTAVARQQQQPPPASQQEPAQRTTTPGQTQSGAQSGNSQQATPNEPGAQQRGQTPNQGGANATVIGGAPATRPTNVITNGRAITGAARVAANAPQTLSLADAIRLAVENNLATLLAQERKREAEGLRTESRAGLLPNISAAAYQASVTQNLAALGFQPGTFPGISRTFIGPFNNFDARARLVQNIF